MLKSRLLRGPATLAFLLILSQSVTAAAVFKVDCEDGFLTATDTLQHLVPMDPVQREELLGIAIKELCARWDKKTITEIRTEVLDRLTMIRLLKGSVSSVLDRLPAFSVLRRHPLNEIDLVQKAERLLDPTRRPTELISQSYIYEDVMGVFELAGECGPARSVIAEAIARGHLKNAVALIARSQCLTNQTHDQLLLMMKVRLLKPPLISNMSTMVNVYSLLKNPENQTERSGFLRSFARPNIVFQEDDQLPKIAIEAQRVSGEVVSYLSEGRNLVRPITRILDPQDVAKALNEIDEVMRSSVADRSVDFSQVMEMLFALNSPENETLLRPAAEKWLAQLVRTLNRLAPPDRRPKSTSRLVIKAYAEAIAQLGRLLEQENIITNLLTRVMDEQLVQLENPYFNANGMIYQIWSQLPEEHREAGYEIIYKKTSNDKFNRKTFNEAIRSGAGFRLSRYWPKPFRPAISLPEESADRVLTNVTGLQQQVDQTRATALNTSSDRLALDHESIQRKQRELVGARDGEGLLNLARQIDAYAEAVPRSGPSAVDIYILGLTLSP